MGTYSLGVIRFVDRDMFMRYRGGGIGHKYMREIEEIYENMSRERTHHKEQRCASPSSDPTDPNVCDESGSNDEYEPENTQATETNDNPGGDDSNSGSDSDYQCAETDSGSSSSYGDDGSDDSDFE